MAYAHTCPPNHGKMLADGCYHVYIDMGTNVGHQIRKVYQPQLYPGNPTEELFSKFFGPPEQRKSVCSFGFEANYIHTGRLQRLDAAMNKAGMRVKIHTDTAVSTRQGNVTFFRDKGAAGRNEWATSMDVDILSDKNQKEPFSVRTIDIACFMRREIIGRRMPDGRNLARLPAIVMKSDIEGHDMKVQTHLLLQGLWCYISLIYGEHTTPEFRNKMRSLARLGDCETRLKYWDDETGDDCLPYPGESKPDKDAHQRGANMAVYKPCP